MRQLCVLTGASRGLGAALARGLLGRHVELLCLSRSLDDDLQGRAERAGVPVAQWPMDLAEPAACAARLEQWLQARGAGDLQRVLLINNAAFLEPPAPFQQQKVETLQQSLRVGLEAPLLLTAAVLRATDTWSVERRILNVSSGLGRRPLAGLGAYCAVKAGLDHFTRTLAEEQVDAPNPARVCALAPGIVDTGMQETLRGADPERFAAQAVFADFHRQGALDSSEHAATRVLEYLFADDFGRVPVADVRG